MRIAVGADYHGYRLKEQVKEHLSGFGHEVQDFGCHDEDPVDYPDVAEEAASSVADGSAERAVLVCGTGIGMAITANKVPGVSTAPVTDSYSVERAQKSNNAQVLCLGGKVVSGEVAKLLVDHWLNSKFQGVGSARKVSKIAALEREQQEKSQGR